MVALRPAKLVAETATGWTDVSSLRRGDLVTTVAEQTFKAEGKAERPIVRVRALSADDDRWLWVSADALGDLADRTQIADRSNGRLPPHIQIQTEAIQQAWAEVQRAIAENEKLKPPLADPYFARAEISMLVNDFDAALRDYLLAIRLANASGQDSGQQRAYFERLQQVLEKYDAMPRAPAIGSARAHYIEGVHAYSRGQDLDAIDHLTNAIAVDPTEALFWYYRALAYKRMGQDVRAKHDALMGANAEWRDGFADNFGQALERVQGQPRRWLETYRLGDPRQLRLVGKN
jgi:tetratricopeptide (TPR) repeat protein